MVDITVLGKYFMLTKHPDAEKILEAAKKLSAEWQGMLFRGDIKILGGTNFTVGLLAFCSIPEIHAINSREISNIHKTDPTFLQQFADATSPVTETTTFEFDGITGQLVIEELGDTEYSLIAALAKKGGN